jgi:hypothetical protein
MLHAVELLTLRRARTTREVGPKIARAIPETEVSAVKWLKDLCAHTQTDQERWRFDDRLPVLIVSGDEDDALHEGPVSMRRNKTQRICLFAWKYENDILP